MKYLAQICLVTILAFTACKESKKETREAVEPKQEVVYDSFGEKITLDDAISSEKLLAKFKDLKVGDTLDVKFTSSIEDVCPKKGCWMKLPLAEDKTTFVRFKDYGFFMPLDSKGREVVVNGKAFVKETSVEELQHYAQDAGKTEEEIAAITESKIDFAFEADGVLMKK
ncbi:DUF4920 domain-containing protein [Polaribacter sargassicola]|uniref:DUF4920 domain-containing protein n=1 Tax=Polaribacter sargassicola TaxID=2836891 RepID=UPI001F2415BD|nr:DUF4920 domain-containing protein [Polaribacter sp. DS7-9]MCG1036029.1 DUF4920 domain-containing protein [Polaribacter sp. DS7-9]